MEKLLTILTRCPDLTKTRCGIKEIVIWRSEIFRLIEKILSRY